MDNKKRYRLGLALGILILIVIPLAFDGFPLASSISLGWIQTFVVIYLGIFIEATPFVGILFYFARPEEVLRSNLDISFSHTGCCSHEVEKGGKRIWDTLAAAGDDFVEMVRYLIVGSLLAAGMQTLVPQSMLIGLASGPILSILVMVALAFVLSVCSTVDAFLALAFVNGFPLSFQRL